MSAARAMVTASDVDDAGKLTFQQTLPSETRAKVEVIDSWHQKNRASACQDCREVPVHQGHYLGMGRESVGGGGEEGNVSGLLITTYISEKRGRKCNLI